MPRIFQTLNGIAHREAAAHQRANLLVKTAVAIAFSYAALAWKSATPGSGQLAALSMAVFWLSTFFYVGTIGALTEVKSLRTRVRNHQQAMHARDTEERGIMADIDLIALLGASVLPFVIIMCSAGFAQPHP